MTPAPQFGFSKVTAPARRCNQPVAQPCRRPHAALGSSDAAGGDGCCPSPLETSPISARLGPLLTAFIALAEGRDTPGDRRSSPVGGSPSDTTDTTGTTDPTDTTHRTGPDSRAPDATEPAVPCVGCPDGQPQRQQRLRRPADLLPLPGRELLRSRDGHLRRWLRPGHPMRRWVPRPARLLATRDGLRRRDPGCRAGCQGDSGCRLAEVCDASLEGCIAGCRDTQGCGTGELCDRGLCRRGCQRDSDCGRGYQREHTECLLRHATSSSAGSDFTCAVFGGQVLCWGNDEDDRASPPEGIRAVHVAAGARGACASTVHPNRDTSPSAHSNTVTCLGDSRLTPVPDQQDSATWSGSCGSWYFSGPMAVGDGFACHLTRTVSGSWFAWSCWVAVFGQLARLASTSRARSVRPQTSRAVRT